jgi:uncharacterized membrane protein YoaK (UPF0700 family)
MPVKTLRSLTHVQRNALNNSQLGAVLSFIAGYVNAGGFLAIGRYTSHMSGIISGMGDDLVLGRWLPALAGLSLLSAFICGSATTSIMVNWGRRHDIQSRYALPLFLEAVFIGAFGVLGAHALMADNALSVPLIALLLCFVMGLQNAIITKISNAEIRTTHMTGVVTDIGIELGRFFYWNRSETANAKHLVLANRRKLRAHVMILMFFFIGAVSGASCFSSFGFWAVLPISGFLLILSGVQIASDLGQEI